jgi:hypothetical protein
MPRALLSPLLLRGGGLHGGLRGSLSEVASIALACVLCVCFVVVLACAHGQVRRSEQQEQWANARNVSECSGTGCVVSLPTFDSAWLAPASDGVSSALARRGPSAITLFPAAAPRRTPAPDPVSDADASTAGSRIRVPHISPGFAAFNTSVARVSLHSAATTRVVVGATRVSSFIACPNRVSHPAGTRLRNHVLLTVNNVPFRVTLSDAMLDALWPRGGPQTFAGVEDARPFEIEPGLLGLAATYKLDVPRMCVLVVPLPSDPAFALLSAPRARDGQELAARAVVLLGPTDGTQQKNWMPFVRGADLWLVKYVAPQTNVTLPLAALVRARGVIAHEAEVALSNDRRALHLAGTGAEWRGSTPLATWRSRGCLLAVIHRHRVPVEFEHAFATFDDAWPYALRAVSRPFQLNVDHARFTFVAGLLLPLGEDSADELELEQTEDVAREALVTFGADDCYALAAAFELAAIDALLRQGPDVPALHVAVPLALQNDPGEYDPGAYKQSTHDQREREWTAKSMMGTGKGKGNARAAALATKQKRSEDDQRGSDPRIVCVTLASVLAVDANTRALLAPPPERKPEPEPEPIPKPKSEPATST